jgi:hypothetical protein
MEYALTPKAASSQKKPVGTMPSLKPRQNAATKSTASKINSFPERVIFIDGDL